MTHPTGLGEYTVVELLTEIVSRKPEYQVFTVEQVGQMMNELVGEDEVIDYQLDAEWGLVATSIAMRGIKPIDLKNIRNASRVQQRQSIPLIIAKYGANK